MSADGLVHAALLAGLQDLADRSLVRWEASSGGRARLINLSENATYRVEAPGRPDTALRIHREGYSSMRAIRSELAWMTAIREETGIVTPEPITDREGRRILEGATPLLPRPRHMVLFRWIEGREPDETEDLSAHFRELGRITARLHLHAVGWVPPAGFERRVWNLDTFFGARSHWGDWRKAPRVDAAIASTLERAETVLVRRLEAYGSGVERYGLVHADLRLANLLIHEGDTRVLDFDDCGITWRLYDLAAALSFIEDHPARDELIASWLLGYERVRPLGEADKAEIPSFVLLRRMALLAWIGSHADTDLAKGHAPKFAEGTRKLASAYLAEFA